MLSLVAQVSLPASVRRTAAGKDACATKDNILPIARPERKPFPFLPMLKQGACLRRPRKWMVSRTFI
jgi:hypothetical protein